MSLKAYHGTRFDNLVGIARAGALTCPYFRGTSSSKHKEEDREFIVWFCDATPGNLRDTFALYKTFLSFDIPDDLCGASGNAIVVQSALGLEHCRELYVEESRLEEAAQLFSAYPSIKVRGPPTTI